MTVTIEPITGRYMRLDIHDRPHRLYWEEAGSGIPLLCLHTAGSDGRQFRALLNDPAITSRFRVIVFDMPWHGKSSPPEGWETEEYKLTTDAYVELITTVSQAMNLDRPVAMGCSIGGRVVLELSRRHPEMFRAVIGLQSSAFVQRYFDISYLHKPNIHGRRRRLRPSARDRHRPLPGLHVDRRIRLFLHPRGQPRHRSQDSRR
jgi:pimeloyl-ACP methyl ester carboxylesterase